MRPEPSRATSAAKARLLLAAALAATACCLSPALVLAAADLDHRAGDRTEPPREEDVLLAADAVAAPLNLLAPAAGQELVAGRAAWLAWEPSAAFAGLGRVDEWEAFWSLDDGATFPFRLTPHLDLDVRGVWVEVPDVPTARGRLLLRLGDERREHGVLLPQRFRVATSIDSALGALHSPTDPHAEAGSAGEPALARQPGVVAWVEGTRRGGSWRQVRVRAAPTLGVRLEAAPMVVFGEPAAPDPAPDLVARRPDPASSLFDHAGRASPAPPTRLPVPPDILLLGQRRNE